MLKKIAVTGAIASGKSTVCHVFRELGAYVVSADQIVHQLLSTSYVIEQVVALLGTQILKDGVIDRERVSRIVFADPTLLHKLEALLHPLVLREIINEFQKAEKASYTLFVAEVPLLFEAGFNEFFDETIAVYAPEADCIARFGNDYSMRMKRQLSPLEKAERATYVLNNNAGLKELETNTKNLFTKIHP